MKPASKFEIAAARMWNVLNEGKSFHPVFRARDLPAASPHPASERGVMGKGNPRPGTGRPARPTLHPLRFPAQAALGAVGIPGGFHRCISFRGLRGVGADSWALRVLHGLLLGHVLLSSADRRTQNQLHPVLATRSRKSRLDQWQLPGADTESPSCALHARIPIGRTTNDGTRLSSTWFYGGDRDLRVPDPQ